MSEQYDFFAIGQKHARDTVENIKKLAEQYEREFGKQAREDFETGIASEMVQHLKFPNVDTRDPQGFIHGTKVK